MLKAIMNCEEFKERVYMTVTGLICASLCTPEAKNLYARGEECDLLYAQVREAYDRICMRLDAQEKTCSATRPKEEDRDLDQILNLMDRICQAVGYEMFRCGAFFQEKVDTGEDIDLFPFAGSVTIE